MWENKIWSNILKTVSSRVLAITAFSVSGGSLLQMTEALTTRKIKSPVSPAAFSLGSSETKHPILFLGLLSCSSIYATIPKDSVITLLRLSLGMNSKEKAGGTACTKTHTLHPRNYTFLDKNRKINSILWLLFLTQCSLSFIWARKWFYQDKSQRFIHLNQRLQSSISSFSAWNLG